MKERENEQLHRRSNIKQVKITTKRAIANVKKYLPKCRMACSILNLKV